MYKRFTVIVMICLLASLYARAAEMDHTQHSHSHHHDAIAAPIGVMGDHTHEAGDWMVSYRYMFMEMDGNRDGGDRVSTAAVLTDFMVAPTEMTMEMHMLGAMVAPTDKLTLMTMVPYIQKEMDHVTRMGGAFTTETDGMGDVKVSALYLLKDWARHRAHLNLGVSLPTGSIDEKDTIPAGHVRLPYPMQLGSGTYDLMPGITWLGHDTVWSWGSQLNGVIRLGENDNDYTLGNKVQLTGWTSYKWAEWLSTSLRIDLQDWGNIDGADPRLVPGMVPTADPGRRAGSRLDLGIGANISGAAGVWEGHRFAIEYLFPLHEDLDGPQLETDGSLILGWQKLW